MFNFFKKKPKANRLPDQVWMNTVTKYLNICKLALSRQSSSQTAVLIYFFPKTGQVLQSTFQELGIGRVNTLEGVDTASTLFLVNAQLLEQNQQKLAYLLNLPGVELFFAEHFPTLKREKEILDKIKDISTQVPVTFHCSLDEPFFKTFGSENIINLMLKMGMDESESISHNMINASIERAQAKIEEKVIAPLSADSAEEWMRINII
jgi:hypothetical protein